MHAQIKANKSGGQNVLRATLNRCAARILLFSAIFWFGIRFLWFVITRTIGKKAKPTLPDPRKPLPFTPDWFI